MLPSAARTKRKTVNSVELPLLKAGEKKTVKPTLYLAQGGPFRLP
jgi:hypothetical protein